MITKESPYEDAKKWRMMMMMMIINMRSVLAVHDYFGHERKKTRDNIQGNLLGEDVLIVHGVELE